MKKNLSYAGEQIFWYWINERHSIYLRRAMGLSFPWTKDPILKKYKFTNPFRENDKTTVWLKENIIKYDHKDNGLLLFNICWFRLFNLIETGIDVGYCKSFNTLERKIYERHAKGQKLFTSAFMQRGYADIPKHVSILNTCEKIWNTRHALLENIVHGESLKTAFDHLRQYNMIGNFYAYEIVCDLYHTPILKHAHDINTWANVGPGAKRGIQRLHNTNKCMNSESYNISFMVQLLNNAKFKFEHKWPIMELRDIEHSLCEFDKYCRVKFHEGRTKELYTPPTTKL